MARPGSVMVVPDQAVPPEDFVEQVKDALEHLYDFPYLQQHPLARKNRAEPEDIAGTTAQRLRRELVSVIETLNPGADVPFRSPHGRLYNVLHLRYVEGMTVHETANELGISARQAYRDLRRGEESVAAMVWTERHKDAPQETRATRLSSLQAEMARLETRPRSVDVLALLQQAQRAVELLARQHEVRFQVNTPPSTPRAVSADPVVAHQILVTTLSHVVQQARPGTVTLALEPAEAGLRLNVQYEPGAEARRRLAENPVVAHLVDRLGWTIHQDESPVSGAVWTLSLHMAAFGPTILVVDDNEGLVELLSRYLGGQACRVTAASSGQVGLQLAQELLPDAIILDVMMPEMDGWEFLQRLRANPATASIPVIICSVFNDPELAFSLGASLVLAKPVSRNDVLAGLRQIGVV